MYFGRAFELTDEKRTIVLPCPFCGNPCFEPEKHMCPKFYARLLIEAERTK